MFETLNANSVKANPSERRASRSMFATERFYEWRLGLTPSVFPLAHRDVPLVIAVGGGKGGVGKSVLSANLAITLANQGMRVLAIDLDLGCSNLHTHFGSAVPAKTLVDFVIKKRANFVDIINATPVAGAAFVAAGREEEWKPRLDVELSGMEPLWEAVFNARRNFKVDIVIFDLGAGTHRHTMNFFAAAHLGILTVLPEPTSIENAYVFLRMALWDIVENVGRHLGQEDVAQDIHHALANVNAGSIAKGYVDCFRKMVTTCPEFIHHIVQVMKGRHMGIVINQARSQADIDIGKSMEHICQKFFGFQSRYLGFVNQDESVFNSLRNRHVHVLDYPRGLMAKRLQTISQQSLQILGFQGA